MEVHAPNVKYVAQDNFTCSVLNPTIATTQPTTQNNLKQL